MTKMFKDKLFEYIKSIPKTRNSSNKLWKNSMSLFIKRGTRSSCSRWRNSIEPLMYNVEHPFLSKCYKSPSSTANLTSRRIKIKSKLSKQSRDLNSVYFAEGSESSKKPSIFLTESKFK